MATASLSLLRDAAIQKNHLLDGPSVLIYALGSLEIICFWKDFTVAVLDYLLKCYSLFLNLERVSFQANTYLCPKAQLPLSLSLEYFLLSQGHSQLLFTLLMGFSLEHWKHVPQLCYSGG